MLMKKNIFILFNYYLLKDWIMHNKMDKNEAQLDLDFIVEVKATSHLCVSLPYRKPQKVVHALQPSQ